MFNSAFSRTPGSSAHVRSVLAIDKFRIRVRAAAPKAIWYVSLRRRVFAGLAPTVSLDRFFSHTGIHLALGEVKLLATALLNPNYVPDMVQVILRLDKSIQHINEDCPLLLRCACASLPIVGVVNAKAVLERGIDVILEDARQINRLLF